jgi:undecaprenyl pyrophosphate phosphatase UppP
MTHIEKSDNQKRVRSDGKSANLAFAKSFSIGLWQCLGFILKTKRSITTIVGGY